eukprot:g1651.t1
MEVKRRRHCLRFQMLQTAAKRAVPGCNRHLYSNRTVRPCKHEDDHAAVAAPSSCFTTASKGEWRRSNEPSNTADTWKHDSGEAKRKPLAVDGHCEKKGGSSAATELHKGRIDHENGSGDAPRSRSHEEDGASSTNSSVDFASDGSSVERNGKIEGAGWCGRHSEKCCRILGNTSTAIAPSEWFGS